MDNISQKERSRQSLIKFAMKFGVTKTAARFGTNWQYIYRWMKRYDGSLASLREGLPRSFGHRSRRPHHHPNEHTEEELALIIYKNYGEA